MAPVNPDLARLLEDPTKAAEVPPEAIARLIGELEQMKATLWARLIRGDVNGQGRPEAPEEDRLLTIASVADRLGVPKSYAYELARRGDLPTVRLGKYVRVPASALQELLGRHRKKTIDTVPMKGHRTRRRGR